MEYLQCNYILSLALFFTRILIREYIIKHQDMKTFLNNPIAISPLEVRYLSNQVFHFTFLWLRLPPLLSLGQAYLARRNDIQPFVFKAFRPPSGMPF